MSGVTGSRNRRLKSNANSKFNKTYAVLLELKGRELTYEELLETKEWRVKRDEVLLKNLYKCKVCGVENRSNHVHHPSYSNALPWEYDIDFFDVLCEKHHSEEHNIDYEND